jgi:hypothetical protein
MKWILVFLCVKEEKKPNENLQATMDTLAKVQGEVNKLSKIPKRESVRSEKPEQELKVVATNLRLVEAKAEVGITIGACYNLFNQLLGDEPQVQWGHIIAEVHNKDPWMGLNGVKHKGFHMKTSKLLEDCIMFHKLTVFSCDAKAMLQDLENIKKVFVEHYNTKARANKAKADTAPNNGKHVSGKCGNGGGSKGPAPPKGCSDKYYKWCKAVGGPFTTHDTVEVECHRFDKDGKQMVKPPKLFDFGKKPWKKGSRDTNQMAYLIKKVEKLGKKLS